MLRDRLIAEVGVLQTADDAARWAQRSLPAKNTLTTADAQLVEASFGAKVVEFSDGEVSERSPKTAQGQPQLAGATTQTEARGRDPSPEVPSAPRSAEAGPRRRGVAAKTIRLRDKDHRKFVSRQPCLVCGRAPSDPHHLRFAQDRGLGLKVSDEFTVPVCRTHHREIHRHGDEAAWWTRAGIEPLPAALMLWRQTHPLPAASEQASAEDEGRPQALCNTK